MTVELKLNKDNLITKKEGLVEQDLKKIVKMVMRRRCNDEGMADYITKMFLEYECNLMILKGVREQAIKKRDIELIGEFIAGWDTCKGKDFNELIEVWRRKLEQLRNDKDLEFEINNLPVIKDKMKELKKQ